ncbi:diguanylate cyclase (GGDEF)-like protein [Chitinivorax tropicus]|uniref:diguanylate cyclase n=1 Tax=Chitinivorax tropicus TaxID=714531 RepID=A0A840MTJ2_9PROT|nr:diguanylate cyclase [Chitinivorax tropicus]MBB5019603.1 diguanylate cyclase (GGDEF)-like protein [Chitinivorax tropicus]
MSSINHYGTDKSPALNNPGAARVQIRRLNDLAWDCQFVDPAQVPRLAGRAEKMASEFDDWLGLGWALINLAFHQIRFGSLDDAQGLFERAQHCFSKQVDRRGSWLVMDGFALILLRQGDPASARPMLQAVLDAPEAERDPLDWVLTLNTLATSCTELNDTDAALRHFYRALEIAERIGSMPRIAQVSMNLGYVHLMLGSHVESLRLLTQAVEIARSVNLPFIMPIAVANLALYHITQGQHATAYELVSPLLGHTEWVETGDLAFFGVIAAQTFAMRGDRIAALRYLHDAGKKAQVAEDKACQTHCLWVESLLARQHGQTGEALALMEQALVLAETVPDRHYLIETLKSLADLYECQGEPTLALHTLKRHFAAREEMMCLATTVHVQSLAIQHEISRARMERDFAVARQAEAEQAAHDLERLNRFLNHKIMEVESLRDQLHELVVRDPLTNLYNRRHLQDELCSALQLAARQHFSLCVVLFDLDHFKVINDTRGHAFGDAVLVAFAELLQSSVRGSDFACRYGGEEFCLVMYDIDTSTAVMRAAEMLGHWCERRITYKGVDVVGLSFSAGVAEYPVDGTEPDRLLSRADAALYRAKQRGRSRIDSAER